MTLPKCQCTAEQYHLFYLLFLMCNDAVNKRINCDFYIICCFISDFRPVVDFNYVSTPKFELSRKVLVMSAQRCSLRIKVSKFLKLSNKQHMGSFLRDNHACTVVQAVV